MQQRRWVVGACVLTASYLLGAGVGYSTVRDSSFTGTQRAEAATGATYLLSGFEILYPYTPTPRGSPPAADAPADASRAGVGFTATWAGSEFPGEVWCEVALADRAGNAVGTQRFLAAYPSQLANPPYLPVEVSSPAVSASGSCEDGVHVPGPGYSFSNLEVRPAARAGWSTVGLTAQWVDDVNPSWRSCVLTTTLGDGTIIRSEFGFAGADGTRVTQDVPASTGNVRDASIACSEVKG